MTLKAETHFKSQEIDYLLSTQAVRERANEIYNLALKGATNFSVNLDKLSETAQFVVQVTREKYPDLNIPFHSRWGHFQVGGMDRNKRVNESLAHFSKDEIARSKIDLAVVSVLLDAGAGDKWSYKDRWDGQTYGRSEGLALASLYMFLDGEFSSETKNTLQVDAIGLTNLTLSRFVNGFQVTSTNSLVGMEGRILLLHSLARALTKNKKIFGDKHSRPGNIYDYLKTKAKDGALPAVEIFNAVMEGFGSIWPGRSKLGDINLGDCWHHSLLGPKGSVSAFVPFHKLSQWLSYSLIEPLEEAGLKVTKLSDLTGLAEYRNGGLLIDTGLISLRNQSLRDETHKPSSEVVIEWRALTVVLLDKIAQIVRNELQRDEVEFPLVKVLEGGTWWAGRKTAARLRIGGTPPLKVESDGTLF